MRRIVNTLIISLFLALPLFAKDTIKVGAYENSPKIFIDANGEVQGFWADITQYIAKQENWELLWVTGTWDQCLERLEKNEIDLMVDVGFTPEREKKFTFLDETVQLSWTRIYRNPSIDIQTILDLQGKRIGGLKGSFDLEGPEGLKAVTDKFEVDCSIIEMENYSQILKALEDGEIDAGITDKDFGNRHDSQYNIAQTNIVLQPAKMLYAFPKNAKRNNLLLSRIEFQLKEMKDDQHSIYYTSLGKHLETVTEVKVMPLWIKILLVIILVLGFIITSFYFILKREVNRKTQKLREDITIIKKIEADLRQSEERFRTLFNYLNDMVIIYEQDGEILDANSTALDTLGYTKNELLNLKLTELINDEAQDDNKKQILEEPESRSSIIELVLNKKNGRSMPVEVSLSLLNLDGKSIRQGIIRDITLRKINEKKLNKYHEHLEDLVKERTEDLKKANSVLEEQNTDLQRMQKLFVGREFRIKELRNEIDKLKKYKENAKYPEAI